MKIFIQFYNCTLYMVKKQKPQKLKKKTDSINIRPTI